MDIAYKGYVIRGNARKETSSYGPKWEPQDPIVNGAVCPFNPKFRNRFFDSLEAAVAHSLDCGKWWIDHPTEASAAGLDQELKDDEDTQVK